MNANFIQNLRYKLQKRVMKLNSIDDIEIYFSYLIQFYNFLREQSIFVGIIDDLLLRIPKAEELANKIFKEKESLTFDSELKSVATSYFVIKKCIDTNNSDTIMNIGLGYNKRGLTDSIEFFHSFFVEIFYEYIDENLDEERFLLYLLKRYKQRCEWFNRKQLFDLYRNDSQRGEKVLSMNLYKYLYDQGIGFFIEPTSVSGEADLVSSQAGEEPLIADAKIFDSEGRNKSYIIKGFHQIYQYTLDYNEPFGYLIIYKVCQNDLNFALGNQEQSISFLTHNNKTIFFIVIDIFPHDKSASEKGKLRTYTISEDDLVKEIE